MAKYIRGMFCIPLFCNFQQSYTIVFFFFIYLNKYFLVDMLCRYSERGILEFCVNPPKRYQHSTH